MPTVILNAEASPRFAFGKNWSHFLSRLSSEQVATAQRSLEDVFGPDGLRDRSFLDLGCGSGLFSLTAYRMGARVTSVDIDPDSVKCSEEIRRSEQADDERWTILAGSALDESALERLGTFDVVYSWGVLHHTGELWRALDLVARRVASGGTLWLAIYNDQGTITGMWRRVKQIYVKLPHWLQLPYLILIGGVYYGQRAAVRIVMMILATLIRLVTFKNPLVPWQTAYRDIAVRQEARGMSRWTDLVDWVGGYPFETAKPEDVFHFLRDRGFQLQRLKTCGGGLGCNEFVLRKAPCN
jgi:2-polyprenyl-6-hydroxyphenyl methylase/3-demethylubiquinone-9 3-methyltransferase